MAGYYQGLLGAQGQLAEIEQRRRATGLLDLQGQRAQAELQRENELAPLRLAQEQGKLAEFQAGAPSRQAAQQQKGEEGALGLQEKRLKMLTTAKQLFTSVGDQQSLDQANRQFEQFTGQPSPYRSKPFTPDFKARVFQDLATIDQQLKMQQLQQGRAGTVTEVVDPADRSRMLRVQSSIYKGGSLGAPGVVGVSGKEPTFAKREEKEAQGKELLRSELENLRTDFDLLYKKGAIPSSAGGTLSNVGAWARGTTVGQLGGRMIASEEQDARNRIQSARLRLLNAIKNATGMSGQQLNSNVELQTWLDSMTSLTGSYESNMGIIDAIENAFPEKGTTQPKPRRERRQSDIGPPPPGAVRPR